MKPVATSNQVVNQYISSCNYSFIINSYQVDIFLYVTGNLMEVFIDGELCHVSKFDLSGINLSPSTVLQVAKYHLSQYPANLCTRVTTHQNNG